MTTESIKCPNCGESYYSEGVTTRTLMYFPPVYKDGVNVNPDKNISTTRCECMACHHYFYIRSRGGETWVEPSDEVAKSVPVIDASITEFYPTEITTSLPVETATIHMDENQVKLRYGWEIEIEKLKERVAELERLLGL